MNADRIRSAATDSVERVRTHTSRRHASDVVLPVTGDEAVVDDWPSSLPAAWIWETARALTESCLHITGVTEAEVVISQDVRRISLFDTHGRSSSRRTHSVATRVRCALDGGREIRAIAGGAGDHAVHELPDASSLMPALIRQAEARPLDRSWNGRSVTCVFESGWCAGTWLHESVGHLFEADNAEVAGFPSWSIGDRVGPESVTIVDDGTLPRSRATMAADDELVETGRSVLVFGGVFEGHLHCRQTAARRGVVPTGNGRRETFALLPTPRMTNLYMEDGPIPASDVMHGISSGLFVTDIGHGVLDMRSGRYEIEVRLAYTIENGRPDRPVTGLSLCGEARTALAGVIAVGDDLTMEAARGECLKHGQVVPVGLGSPTLVVKDLTVQIMPE
jgi:TldD protein